MISILRSWSTRCRRQNCSYSSSSHSSSSSSSQHSLFAAGTLGSHGEHRFLDVSSAPVPLASTTGLHVSQVALFAPPLPALAAFLTTEAALATRATVLAAALALDGPRLLSDFLVAVLTVVVIVVVGLWLNYWGLLFDD